MYVRLGKMQGLIQAGRIGAIISVGSEEAGGFLRTLTLGSDATSLFLTAFAEGMEADNFSVTYTPAISVTGMPGQLLLSFVGNK